MLAKYHWNGIIQNMNTISYDIIYYILYIIYYILFILSFIWVKFYSKSSNNISKDNLYKVLNSILISQKVQ